jgi:branched-chain amino acid aminotransferase
MYSSLHGGIVTDPLLMMIPIDDHMVHRGDGVFEAMRCVNGSVYNLDAHMDRLLRSASMVDLSLPAARSDMVRTIVETVRAAGHQDAVIRLYASRGPGSFDANPYDCGESVLYVVVTRPKEPFMARCPAGARIKTSAVPVKPSFFATVKSCNYLPNVLMKKEAVEAGVDFVVSLDETGYLAEGAAQNVGVVTDRQALIFPRLDRVLRGTTMVRVMALAEDLVRTGTLREIDFGDIRLEEVFSASEVLLVGTTIDVTAVREFNGEKVGDGKPGPAYRSLSELLQRDMTQNAQMRTPVFPA